MAPQRPTACSARRQTAGTRQTSLRATPTSRALPLGAWSRYRSIRPPGAGGRVHRAATGRVGHRYPVYPFKVGSTDLLPRCAAIRRTTRTRSPTRTIPGRAARRVVRGAGWLAAPPDKGSSVRWLPAPAMLNTALHCAWNDSVSGAADSRCNRRRSTMTLACCHRADHPTLDPASTPPHRRPMHGSRAAPASAAAGIRELNLGIPAPAFSLPAVHAEQVGGSGLSRRGAGLRHRETSTLTAR
jgi:hypothetical protein